MSLLDVGKLALIAIAPTLIGAVVVYAPKWCAALAQLRPAHDDPETEPIGLPIEKLAADLRRLLRLHDELTRSAHIAIRAHRLWAVEAAIGVRAVEAARALDVPHRDPAPGATLSRTELGRLLHALVDAGLVLPTTVGPFTSDGRL
jgi:hypothetical protein